MFTKLGESVVISTSEFKNFESIENDSEILDRFTKFAGELKLIAPKAKDFLYFSAVMMTSAEAAIFNPDGSIKIGSDGNPVNVGWDKSNNSWKWVSSDPSIMPYKNSNCFVPGTKILLEDGSVKNIEDIKVGDQVITHQNRVRSVLFISEKDYDGEVLNITARNNEKITCTPEHPFYKYSLLNKNGTESLNKKRMTGSNTKSYDFVIADELSEGDVLLSPVLNNNITSTLTDGEARLLGLFCAEGSYIKNYSGIVLTFSHLEYDNLAKFTQELFKNVFPENKNSLRLEKSQNKSTLEVYGKDVAQFFLKHVGEYSKNKKLSKEIVFGSDNIKKQFITGWMEGDGHVDKDSGKLVGTTVSQDLASQVRVILNSLNITNNLFYELRPEGKINGRIVPAGFQYRIKIRSTEAKQFISLSDKLNFTNKPDDKKLNTFIDNYGTHSIHTITRNIYSGKVYNFEVEEDHSYVANGVITHNCDIFPEEELIKAHKKWIGRPLCLDHKSSSVDFIRGVIVDTYYDKKNKRVIALCALDKVNYPDLARKVSTGYASSVSMGTAVGRAICTTCGTVAKIESDFCNHMRSRECYGEINVDLTPIELSIVVNGADPQAKIKHIVAAADALSIYTQMKQENNKLNISTISDIKQSVAELSDKLLKLESDNKDSNDVSAPYGVSSGSYEMHETELPAVTDQSLNGPTSLPAVIASVHAKLDKLQNDLDKLSQINNKEITMVTDKKAYFQGGGGVNEPTPGKTKYEKEEADKIRDTENKHMVGQMDTGPVDGMHPGYDSFGESEEARKKRLQRMAETDLRAAKRAEAVAKAKANLNKSAYYQGGEGVNEPTPGKPKYPKEDSDKIRENDDKQMNGQPPFPGVGSVDGLHPSPASVDIKDELKRKEMLSRAKLIAKFVKAANADGTENQDASRWDVYAGDKLVLTTTVGEILGKNPVLAYEDIATKPFGFKILDSIKTAGFDKAKALFKGAQEVAAPGALPATPPDMGGAAPAPVDMGAAPPVDESDAGDPAKRAHELAEKVRDAASDLEETIDVLTGEGKELAGVDELHASASDKITTNSLQSIRKDLNNKLIEGMKEAVAGLKSHEEELKLCEQICSQGKIAKLASEDKSMVSSLTKDAFVHAEKALVDSDKLLAAFVNYAHGTDSLEDIIAEEAKLNKSAQIAPPASTTEIKPMDPMAQELMNKLHAPGPTTNEMAKKLEDAANGQKADDVAMVADEKDEKESDKNEVTVDLNPEQMKQVLEHKAASEPDLTTKEGRAQYRAKLAQKGVEWSDMTKKFHPKGGTTTELDVKPEGDLAKVETTEEQHAKILEIATAPVKKAAGEIQKAIVAGNLTASDVDGLEAHGLDPAAIKYWKQFYGQASDGGSEFASELVKEHAKAKLDEEKQAFTVKVSRAYDLAYEMADRGLIVRQASVIKDQVAEIMKFNDESFESLKKVISRHAPRGLTKEASIPQVGLLSNDVSMPLTSESSDLESELERCFANKRY